MTNRIQTTAIFFLLFANACVEPYYPARQLTNTVGFLVVDGFLDAVNRTARVQLTRSVKIDEYRDNPFELNATVTVESENGKSIKLHESPNGLYTLENVAFDASTRYRVHLTTNAGVPYSSDFIELKRSPSFDSLVWRPETGGVRFYVNSHDDLANTHYYMYRFSETWEYKSYFFSRYKKAGGVPVKRKAHENVDTCWNTAPSSAILIASTKTYARDLVSMMPIHFIGKGDRKLLRLYSLLVEQRALSEDEYEFWVLLKKTNEQLGGLFDPIMSQVTGNIHRDDDPSELVLGYFSGGFPETKRIFLTFDDLPKYLKDEGSLGFECGLGTLQVKNADKIGADLWIEVLDPSINQYYTATAECSDCRVLGGDTTKPSFWPY